MSPLFETYDVGVYAMSKDSPEEVRFHRERDQLTNVSLLSDSHMEMIRAYGLEHHKAIEFKTWNIFGIPLGFPIGYKSMAIPTTLLIDEKGIIRWIDQADDYRMRGDEERVRAALEEAFS